MNLSHKTEPLENRLQSCVEHPFKKARYAWQIKGYINSANRQCLPMACTSEMNTVEHGFHGNTTLESHDEKNCKENNLNCTSTKTSTDSSAFGLENFTVHQDYDDDGIVCDKKNEKYPSDEGNNRNETLACYPSCFKRKSEATSTRHDTKTRVKRIKIKSSESSFESVNSIGTNSIPNGSQSISGEDLSSYMWQKREMGFAIVDNVCNETLEVMGLSPDPKVNLLARARLALEDHSIETAIKNQGLYASMEKKSDSDGDMDVFVDELDHKDVSLDDCIRENELDSMMVSCKPEMSSCSSNNRGPSSVNIQDCFITKIGGYNSQCELDKFSNNYEGETVTKHSTDSSESNNICSAMDHSDSSETVTMRKNSDIVIDLAVSTAIITQGLSYENAT